MVLTALEEAKHMSTSPFGLYAEVLKKRIKEVFIADLRIHKYTSTIRNN